MLCERCKTREANIRYTEVRNGIRSDHALCGQCAREMDLDFGPIAGKFEAEIPIGKILADLFGIDLGAGEKEEFEGSKVVCPTCQTTYSDFLKDSKFGCPDCYRVFDLLMEDKIKKLQGSDIHKGKRPFNARMLAVTEKETEVTALEEAPEGGETEENITNEEKIIILKAKLAEALEEEAYERAAKLRDEIRSLKEPEDGKA